MEFFIIWLAFIVLAVWFLMIRPQKRRMQEHQNLIDSVAPGTHIVTAGGIHGTVEGVEDDVIRVEVAPNTVIRVARRAIARNLDRERDAELGVGPTGEAADDVTGESPGED